MGPIDERALMTSRAVPILQFTKRVYETSKRLLNIYTQYGSQ